jgi:hypothetical protein
MDEIGIFYKAQTNKTLAQGKMKGRFFLKYRFTFALVVNNIGTNKLKILMINKSKS